jgi:hypothetical protein
MIDAEIEVFLFGRMRQRARADNIPDSVWRRWHVDVADAESRERIDHRVNHCRGRADGPYLAAALHAHGRVYARRTMR